MPIPNTQPTSSNPKNYNQPIVIFSILTLLIGGVLIFLVSSNRNQSSSNIYNTQQTSLISTKNNSTDPQDIVAGLYPNQIKNQSTIKGIELLDLKLQDNVDEKGKAVNDNVELTIKNTTNANMDNFEVFYIISDKTNFKNRT